MGGQCRGENCKFNVRLVIVRCIFTQRRRYPCPTVQARLQRFCSAILNFGLLKVGDGRGWCEASTAIPSRSPWLLQCDGCRDAVDANARLLAIAGPVCILPGTAHYKLHKTRTGLQHHLRYRILFTSGARSWPDEEVKRKVVSPVVAAKMKGDQAG